jgi:hypothetical protein
LIIWTFSLVVGWQKFYVLHLLGFVLLIVGTCVYNQVNSNR